MEELGIYMPVTELQCRYLRPAHYDDLLSVKVILKELPDAHKITFDHEVHNEASMLLCVGKVVLYFIDSRTREKTHMPATLRDKLATFF